MATLCVEEIVNNLVAIFTELVRLALWTPEPDDIKLLRYRSIQIFRIKVFQAGKKQYLGSI
jgi:hypothetical protein